MKRIILFWIPLMVIGFCNGVFRGVVLAHFFSDFHARQISSLLLIVWVVIYTYAILDKVNVKDVRQAWLMGFIWVMATIAFEFFLGLVFVKTTVASLLVEYNLFEGRLWSLVLIFILIMPWVFFKFGARMEMVSCHSRIVNIKYFYQVITSE